MTGPKERGPEEARQDSEKWIWEECRKAAAALVGRTGVRIEFEKLVDGLLREERSSFRSVVSATFRLNGWKTWPVDFDEEELEDLRHIPELRQELSSRIWVRLEEGAGYVKDWEARRGQRLARLRYGGHPERLQR